MLKKVIALYFVILMSLTNTQAVAHEFWLQPNTYSGVEGAEIQVNWRVGTNFNGQSFVYLPSMASYVGIYQAGQLSQLTPRFAAKPTLRFKIGSGTTIGITESTDFVVEYQNYDAFFAFIEKEQLTDQLIVPTESPSGLTFESYRRFTKTLLSTRGQVWQDSAVGLDFEWLLTRLGSNLRGTLLINGEPAANYPVKLFAKAKQGSTDISVQKTHTDSSGEVLFTKLDLGHLYLINAIKLRPSALGDTFDKATWHTDWASTTFKW